MKDTYTMRQIFGALLAGLSKAFDCIPHELIIAKLQAYKHKNLSKTICQIENKELKSMAYIVRGKTYFLVFHRDPYFFNIHLCGLFYFLENLDIARYADDTTIYTINETKESVIGVPQTFSSLLFGWLKNNFIKANSDKSHWRFIYWV